MTHPLIISLQQIEQLVSSLNLLLHLMGTSKLTDGDFMVLDDNFEDILCRVENIRMKLEQCDLEVEL